MRNCPYLRFIIAAKSILALNRLWLMVNRICSLIDLTSNVRFLLLLTVTHTLWETLHHYFRKIAIAFLIESIRAIAMFNYKCSHIITI